MVLNMADFGKSWKSLQTLLNASKTILKWFVTPCATVCVDLGGIRKGRKLADFEQKAWAIAHGFEHGRFWQVLKIAPNSLKRLQNRSKMIYDCLRDCLIYPKSTQTVAQAVINPFRTVLEAFQRVWSDFQDLPKSAMFKTMGYSPGRLLKIGQFSTVTNSP